MIALIVHFWDKAELACRAEGNFGRIFKADRGVTQGGPLSPKIFNILVLSPIFYLHVEVHTCTKMYAESAYMSH